MICDAHVHFFSPGFFDGLGAQMGLPAAGRAAAVVSCTGWDDPVSAEALADRWVGEMDRHGVARAALIASVPGDETSVAVAVARHASRFIGFFMLNPLAEDALDRVAWALDAGLRGICLFPAMHRYSVHDERAARVFHFASSVEGPPAAVFVHCGILSVGVRAVLGMKSPFDLRFGNPLDLHAVALEHPAVPIIIPHFGAGMLREALMVAGLCPNVYLDTSSSNAWMRTTPGLTLAQVFRATIDVAGASRVLFGTDSSHFPRGWNGEVFDAQVRALDEAQVPAAARDEILGGAFARLFPTGEPERLG